MAALLSVSALTIPWCPSHEDRLKLDGDKIKDWMGKGAQPTDRVAKLMAQAGLGDAPAIPTQTKKNQPKAKAQQRAEEKAEKAREAAEGRRRVRPLRHFEEGLETRNGHKAE